MVFDRDVQLPGCEWTDAHGSQGFARRESVMNFGMLEEFGHAVVLVRDRAYEPRDYYVRVIAVPFLVTSGQVKIEGPEEHPIERQLELSPGNYRLTAAQFIIWDEEQGIDLFFEKLAEPLERSEVLVADEWLDPILPLCETAEIAGGE